MTIIVVGTHHTRVLLRVHSARNIMLFMNNLIPQIIGYFRNPRNLRFLSK